MIDLNKKYRTRDGRDVRILATDVKHLYFPVAAVVISSDGNEWVQVYTKDGSFHERGAESYPSGLDLIEVPVESLRFVNLYPDAEMSPAHNSRAEADAGAQKSKRIGVLKLTFHHGKYIGTEHEVP